MVSNGLIFFSKSSKLKMTQGFHVRKKQIYQYQVKSMRYKRAWKLTSQGIKIYEEDNTLGSKEWFVNRDHLFIGCNPCTKFGINQVKGSKDIEWTTQWAQKSGLTLTFEHVTWKSIGIIYSLRATPAPSLVLIKWRDQKILSGQHSGLRRMVWPWPLNMWPENQYGSFTHWG